MEVLRELMKRPQQAESLAIAVFVIASLYTVYAGTGHTALLGVGFTLIVLGALPRQIALAFLVGASAIMLVQKKTAQMEGFADAKAKTVEKAKDAKAKEKAAIAICVKSVLQSRGRTLKRFSCKKKGGPQVLTQSIKKIA